MFLFLAFWLAPCIPTYVLVSWNSGNWRLCKKDWLLLVPVLNWIILGFVLCILFDELISRLKY